MTEVALAVKRLEVTLGSRSVLDGVSFELVPGNLLGVIGPNGAGKTTLLKAVLGLLPYRGEVVSFGTNLRQQSARDMARRIAYVPQKSELQAALSVHEVVASGRFCHDANLTQLSARDASAVEDALQKTDLSALRTRRFTRLSGGEQRRVLLARALATEAPLILLDEPAASLDLRHALVLFHHVADLARAGKVVVMVLHDLNEARHWCSHALLLSEGRTVAFGLAADVIKPELIEPVYGVSVSHGSNLSFALPERLA